MFWCSHQPTMRLISHHQINFSVQINVCTGYTSVVARQKDSESDEITYGEFLWVVIIGEYNVACRCPFSGIDSYPPHAIAQTDISTHSRNPSEQLCMKHNSLQATIQTRLIFRQDEIAPITVRRDRSRQICYLT